MYLYLCSSSCAVVQLEQVASLEVDGSSTIGVLLKVGLQHL